jgi:hypothetical protein
MSLYRSRWNATLTGDGFYSEPTRELVFFVEELSVHVLEHQEPDDHSCRRKARFKQCTSKPSDHDVKVASPDAPFVSGA